MKAKTASALTILLAVAVASCRQKDASSTAGEVVVYTALDQNFSQPIFDAFTQKTGYMPVRKSATDLPAEKTYLDANPNAKTAVEQLPHTKSQDNARVFVPGGGKRIGAALDRIVQGGDVSQVFAQLQQETQQVIDRDIKPKL